MDFFLNNINFTIEVAVAVVFFTASWLSYDSFKTSKSGFLITRSIGFSLAGFANIVSISLTGSELILYLHASALILGFFLILISFLEFKRLEIASIIIIPSFIVIKPALFLTTSLICILISFFSFYKAKKELNKNDYVFSMAFIFLAIGYSIVALTEVETVTLLCAKYFSLIMGAFLIGRWLWRYMQMRFEESFIVVLVSSALLLATIITLAFSTLLIERLNNETYSNLSVNTKVIDLSIKGLMEEARIKAKFLSRNDELNLLVKSKDNANIGNLINDFQDAENVGFITVADQYGDVLVRAHNPTRYSDSIVGERGFDEVYSGRDFITIDTSDTEGISIRAYSPIKSNNEVVGIIIAGFQLDNAYLDNIKKTTGLEMFIFDKMSPVSSTAFSQNGTTRLTGNEINNEFIKREVLENGKFIASGVQIGGVKFKAGFMPLFDGDKQIIGMISSAKTEGEIMKIINDTNRLTLIVIIIVLFFLSWPIYFLSKKVVKQFS